MSTTRTFTLSNTLANIDTTPMVGVQIYVYLQTPGDIAVRDLDGRIYFSGQPWGQSPKTNGSGFWQTTDVFPGDLRDGNGNQLVTPAQLVVIEGDQKTVSPPAFVYAASITVSTWYPSATGNASGMLPMILDLAQLDTSPAVGFPVLYTLSTSADAPDGRSYLGGVPIPESSNVNGISLITLWPTSLLDPTSTAYLAQLPDSTGTTWKFTVPTVPTGYVGAYNAGATYFKGDGTKAGAASVVLWTDGLYYQYINVTPASGHDPTNPAYWQLWPGEPIIWHRTEISGQGIPRIDTTGVRPSPNMATTSADPVNPRTTLDDDIVDLAFRDTQRLRWLGAWSGATAYLANDVVSDSAADYICILGHTNQEPPNGTYWTALAGGSSAITTAGDLETGAAGGSPARLPVGTPGQIPGPVGGLVAWITPTDVSGMADPTTTDGDLIYRKKTTVTSLAIGWIGDSWLTQTPSGSTIPTLVAGALNAATGLTVTTVNEAISGTSTTDWAPGGSNYLAAVAAFASASVKLVVIGLVVNDARVAVRNSAATYQSNMQAIVNDLVGRGYTVGLVYPTYCVPGSNSGDEDATANTLRIAYARVLDNLVNGFTIRLVDTSLYSYFSAHSGDYSDGIHPTAGGQSIVAGFWAKGMQRVVSALTQMTTLQRLILGTNLSISGNVLNVSGAASTHYEPVVLDNPGGTAPIFIVNSNGQVVMTPIGN